jgi:transcriptional regulator with XRE-family HTH domain
MITPEQIRGARAMLGLTQAELAKNAGISTTGLNNIERGSADPKASTLRAIRAALEAAGIEFTNGGQPGVRMKEISRDLRSQSRLEALQPHWSLDGLRSILDMSINWQIVYENHQDTAATLREAIAKAFANKGSGTPLGVKDPGHKMIESGQLIQLMALIELNEKERR